MKKSIILIISAIFLASCSPKKPAATTTPVQGTQTITTTVFKTQGNKSNSSNTKRSLTGTNTVKKNENKSNADNREANESEGNESRNSENTKPESEETNNAQNNEANSENNNQGREVVNNEEAESQEGSSAYVAIDEETIATPVFEANNTQVKLPAESSELEAAGFKIDWDSKKYSDADGKNYVHADFNGQDIILGLSDNDSINEIELKGTDEIVIPGGFTVGSSKQEFRDKFGYWGGDIYTIDGTTYVITGEDTIESITIKAQ